MIVLPVVFNIKYNKYITVGYIHMYVYIYIYLLIFYSVQYQITTHTQILYLLYFLDKYYYTYIYYYLLLLPINIITNYYLFYIFA